MTSDEPVLAQSRRGGAYAQALDTLRSAQRTYLCGCTRAQRAADALAGPYPDAYPGTCRTRALAPPGAERFRLAAGIVRFDDRACGPMAQDVEREAGDPVVLRADGCWAYQLAVVVDDGFQGITDIVRGADLLDNTPRQILLQEALGLPRPRYLHIPLVRDATGRKLSKQDDDAPLDAASPKAALELLEQALIHLGFARTGAARLEQFQQRAVDAWRARMLPLIAAAPAAVPAAAPAAARAAAPAEAPSAAPSAPSAAAAATAPRAGPAR